MMEILEDVSIRCGRCGKVAGIHKEDFDPDDAYPEYSHIQQLIMDIAQDRELICILRFQNRLFYLYTLIREPLLHLNYTV